MKNYIEICRNEPGDFDKYEDVNGHHLQSEPLQRSLFQLQPRICNMQFQSLNHAMSLKIAPCLSKYVIDIYSYLTFKAFNNKHFEALLVKFTRRCILYLTYEHRNVKLAFIIKFKYAISTYLISNHYRFSYRIAYFMYFMSFRCDLVFSYSATQHVW